MASGSELTVIGPSEARGERLFCGRCGRSPEAGEPAGSREIVRLGSHPLAAALALARVVTLAGVLALDLATALPLALVLSLARVLGAHRGRGLGGVSGSC